MHASLVVTGLRKVYEGAGRRVEAVRDLTFTVDTGELVCLVGPSGCGKTTLLRCMAGLLTPTAGEVRLAGRPVSGPPPGMAFVFQEYGRSLFPWMRVGENVELPLRQKRLGRGGGANSSPTRWSPSACRTRPAPIRGSCPAGCSSGSPSPGPWPTSPRCC